MAIKDRRQLKVPRSILSVMTGGNPQAIKAFENMQSAVFDEIPDELKVVIEQALSDAMQASMMANQAMQLIELYLHAVSVPAQYDQPLDGVSVVINDNNTLDAINPIFNDNNNYLVSV